MKPLTRREIFERAIAKGEVPTIKPLTRKEIIMAKEAKREASGDGASDCDWNIMKNKPFGEEVKETVLYDEEIVTTGNDSNGCLVYSPDNVSENDVLIKAGQTYKVLWDGKEYECLAKETQATFGTLIYIGDGGRIDNTGNYEESDDPFTVSYEDTGYGDWRFKIHVGEPNNWSGENETHTISISTVETTVKTIDEKFIPETIARVEDCQTLISPNGTKYQLTVSDDGTLSATPVE